MGLTYPEAEALGLATEHPDHPSRRQPKARAPKVNEFGQNKTEEAFDRMLEDMVRDGKIRDFRWEPITIRLAGRTSLKIDFLVQRMDRSIAAVEIKGFMRDDAAVKLKVAPKMLPFFEYYVAFRAGAGWDVRYVGRAGIGAIHEPNWWVRRGQD